MVKIEYPLKIDLGDGTVWNLNSPDEVGNNLEWLDTEKNNKVQVWDRQGRSVRLKVEACNILLCELIE